MSKVELRCANFDLEIEQREDGAAVLRGYAAIFDERTDLGWFTESVAPGAFARALKEQQDVRALIDHRSEMVIGRTKSGTLRLKEDSRGLYCEIDVPDTTAGRDLVTTIKRGDVSGMSFGFRVVRQEWEQKKDEKEHRTLIDVDLFDVSPVTYPAYEGTSIALRSGREAVDLKEVFEARQAERSQAIEQQRAARKRALKFLQLGPTQP